MRNSWKLGVFAALCASVAIVGCGDDAGDDGDNGGAGSGGTTNKAGNSGAAGKLTGGTSSGNGGSLTGGSAGSTAAGSGGKAGGGGTAGSAGSAGSSGSAGTAGTGNDAGAPSDGGTGGVGGAGEGGSGGGGAPTGEGGAGGEATGCTGEDPFGGEGGGGGAGSGAPFESALILIDNVQVKTGAVIKHQWQFADAAQISTALPGNNPGDKWSRWYGVVNTGSEIGFSCDGNPAAGSLKNLVPFTAANQYHELGVPFAQEDYTGLTITAKVKLVSGGKNDATCPARVALYVVGPNTAPITGPGVALSEGAWVDVTQTVAAATGTTTIDRIGFNLNTYACQ